MATVTKERDATEESETEFDATEMVMYNDEEMTLDEATKLEKLRLEIQLCDRTEAVTEAAANFKTANETAKEKKAELDSRESMLWSTNRDLRRVLLGQWKPEKPDPQREFQFEDGEESASVWKSKPIEELGLSKNINRILENAGFTTVGICVTEIDEGQGFLNIDELTEGHIGKILKAVAEFRSKLDLGGEG